MKKSTTVSEPLVDLPSSIGASLPSYVKSSSFSSGVITKCEVIEKKDDSMLVDKHDAQTSYDDDWLDEEMDYHPSDREFYEGLGRTFNSRRDPISRLSPEAREALGKYWHQVYANEGFDFIEYPEILHPYPKFEEDGVYSLYPDEPDVVHMTKLAMDYFNNSNQTEYKVVEVEKANRHLAGVYEIYYITFVAALDVDGDESAFKTFEGKVADNGLLEKTEVNFCRVAKNINDVCVLI